MLEVRKISTGYGNKQVLFDVSFEVKRGEIVLLTGSNGSGKSTLLKAIYGLLPQWGNGQIYFSGENITGKPTSTLLKKGLLYIPQKNNLFEDLTVKENLEMSGLTLNMKVLSKRIEYALSIFTTLVPLLQRIPMKLSGGERQLLTLAMATVHQPFMILADELLNGLSYQNTILIVEYLKVLNQQKEITILIVEQRIKECTAITNKIIGLKLGKVFSITEVNENFNTDQLNSLFV